MSVLRIAYAALLALAHISTVAGHGYVWSWDIDGTTYEGELDALGGNPNSAQRPRILYDTETENTERTVACGSAATEAGKTWNINAGAKVTARWSHGPGGQEGVEFFPADHWGPVMEYMAACPDSGCNGVDAASLDWFKISEAGYTGSPTIPGQDLDPSQFPGWEAADKIIKTGDRTFTIPSEIAPGYYLVRHEILSIQSVTGGGPQSYPVCFQANVKGSGSLKPKPEELAKFPDLYRVATDIYSVGFWKGGAENYEIPGPRPIGSGVPWNPSGGNGGGTEAAGGSAGAGAQTEVAQTSQVAGEATSAAASPTSWVDPAVTTGVAPPAVSPDVGGPGVGNNGAWDPAGGNNGASNPSAGGNVGKPAQPSLSGTPEGIETVAKGAPAPEANNGQAQSGVESAGTPVPTGGAGTEWKNFQQKGVEHEPSKVGELPPIITHPATNCPAPPAVKRDAMPAKPTGDTLGQVNVAGRHGKRPLPSF